MSIVLKKFNTIIGRKQTKFIYPWLRVKKLNLTKMKKIICTSLLFLIAFTCIKFSSVAFAGLKDNVLLSEDKAIISQKPKIYFTEINFDFGKVKEGETLSHNFTFKNLGNEKLVISSVQPACGCTGATLNGKSEFAKDEQGEIGVTFNTQGRTGLNKKTIQVNTNDESNPSITLSFSCDVQ